MTKFTKQKTQQIEQKTYLLERLGSFKFHHSVKKRQKNQISLSVFSGTLFFLASKLLTTKL